MKKEVPRAPRTREDKIKLLLDLNSGKMAIEDAVPGPKRLRIWHLKDGDYKSNTGIVMSEDEFKKRPKSPALDVVIIRRKPEQPAD